MEIMIVILCIIILFLGGYLFFMKKELKRIRKEADLVLARKTNGLVHVEFMAKEIRDLVECINTHLTVIKSKESELERKNGYFIKMMRNISHDLRTPLTSALGYVSLLLDAEMPEKEKVKNLQVIQERLERLSLLIDSFFEFSKVLSDMQNIELKECNLVAIIEKAISNHYEDFSSDKRVIEFKTSKRKIELRTNELMLMRVFDNLILNAYKHSDGNLTIAIASYDNKVQIQFINKLLARDLDVSRIFEEFYTVDISRTKGNTGLGLAIAKEFVEQLNGKIEANKKNNQFIITLTF